MVRRVTYCHIKRVYSRPWCHLRIVAGRVFTQGGDFSNVTNPETSVRLAESVEGRLFRAAYCCVLVFATRSLVASVSLIFMVLYTFLVTSSLPFSELSLVGLALDLVD